MTTDGLRYWLRAKSERLHFKSSSTLALSDFTWQNSHVSESPDTNWQSARSVLESRLNAKAITFNDGGKEMPGGMCNCCGGGPNPEPEWRAEPWLIYRAGICDADGVYFSMLCEGCLEDIRDSNARRPKTLRDEYAELVTELLGEDLEGAQSMMDDFAETGELERRLPLGQIVMTRGVAEATTELDRISALQRHKLCDWGEVCKEDAESNDWSAANGARIISSYTSLGGVKFWIITEADRSATTLLLPEEY